MPVITKQVANSKPTKREGILDRIEPVGASKSGLKFSCYGRGKTGKTRLACSFPKPLLLMGTEDGTKSVVGIKGIDFIRLQASKDIEELTNLLQQGKYKTAVLDTAGGLQDMILAEVLGLADLPVQKTFGMAQRGDWMMAGTQWKERMRGLFDLADKQELNVVVIAHERNFNEESTSDVMLPSIGSALTPTVAAWVNSACDYVCQCFIRQQEVMKETVLAGKKTQVKQATGKVEYCLRIGPHPVFMTGFRLPEGQELPDVIVSANYEKIAKLIRGDRA